ncbi:MAG: HD domain-containing protein [Deltaproteobacteria bacterium]|nr:MAG: HD domain-containing protein [Deltaproteobacteria bacterium]
MLPDPSAVPADVLAVLRGLRAAGKQAFIAGGAVRDLVRLAQGYKAKPPQDFDVATDALPEEVAKFFPRVIPTGAQHGTVTVLSGEHKVEVTTFRGEGPYLDGRRPSSVTFLGDIEGDLARRDFTVNAMAWDPIEGVLRDPFGGVEDLRRCRLRAVGNALARFQEDGLRPLRAVRFACTLRLAIEPDTRRAISQALETFSRVAQERVRDELIKLLVRGDPPSRGLRLLLRTGLLGRIIPELLESVHFVQNRYHAYDVWRHTLRCVDYAAPDLEVRLAALLHDVAKPRCAAAKADAPGEHTFYDHEKTGAELAEQILQRLRFPRREVERVALLVREHNWHYQPEWNDATVRRTLARIGPAELPALWELRRADLKARGRFVEEGLKNQAEAEDRFARELLRASALKVTDLAVSGEDVMRELRLRPGPEVGRILAWLLDRVIDDPDLNTREVLIRLLPEALEKLSTANSQGSLRSGARENTAPGGRRGK